jgi:hypothetical protein
MSISASVNTLKQKIIGSLNNLPPEGLHEVEIFLDYIRFKLQKTSSTSTPYLPIALGGLWKNETISDKDIDDIRKEMWQSMEKREL